MAFGIGETLTGVIHLATFILQSPTTHQPNCREKPERNRKPVRTLVQTGAPERRSLRQHPHTSCPAAHRRRGQGRDNRSSYPTEHDGGVGRDMPGHERAQQRRPPPGPERAGTTPRRAKDKPPGGPTTTESRADEGGAEGRQAQRPGGRGRRPRRQSRGTTHTLRRGGGAGPEAAARTTQGATHPTRRSGRTSAATA